MISIRLARQSEFDNAKKLILSIFPDAIVRLDEDDTLVLAECKGKLIGFVHIIEEDDRILLQGMGVDKNWRGQGVGTILMEHVVDVLDSTSKPVYIKVKAMNPAVTLYERYGFLLKKFGDTHLLVKKPHA